MSVRPNVPEFDDPCSLIKYIITISDKTHEQWADELGCTPKTFRANFLKHSSAGYIFMDGLARIAKRTGDSSIAQLFAEMCGIDLKLINEEVRAHQSAKRAGVLPKP